MSLLVRFRSFAWLAVGAILASASCGGKAVVDAFGTDGVGGSGGDAGSGGDGSSGEPGSGGAGGGSGSVTPTPSCKENEVGFGGTIEGVPLLDSVALGRAFGTDDFTGATTASDGVFVAPTSEAPAPLTHLGIVRLPSPQPSVSSPLPSNPGEWLCSPDMPLGESVVGFPAFLGPPVTFTGLRRLGTCPGTPIGGQVICDDTACDLGEIGGTMTGGSPDASLMFFFQGGLFINLGAESGGALLLPRDHPDAEALYCVGSVVLKDNVVTMGKLSRLGRCAEAEPVSGSISVCEGSTF